MCRSDVDPDAVPALAALLAELAAVLAAEANVDPALVRVGPVDFGPERDSPLEDV